MEFLMSLVQLEFERNGNPDCYRTIIHNGRSEDPLHRRIDRGLIEQLGIRFQDLGFLCFSFFVNPNLYPDGSFNTGTPGDFRINRRRVFHRSRLFFYRDKIRRRTIVFDFHIVLNSDRTRFRSHSGRRQDRSAAIQFEMQSLLQD